MGQTDGQTSMNVYSVAAYRGVSQKNNVVYIFSVCILQSLTSLLASFSRVGVDKLITTQLRRQYENTSSQVLHRNSYDCCKCNT